MSSPIGSTSDPEDLSNSLAALQAERDALAAECEELALYLDAARDEIEGLREALLSAERNTGGGWCKSLEDCTQFRQEREEKFQEALDLDRGRLESLVERNRRLERAMLDLLVGKLPSSVLALIRERFWEVHDVRD